MKEIHKLFTLFFFLSILSSPVSGQIISVGLATGINISKQNYNYISEIKEKYYSPGFTVEINRISQGIGLIYSGYSSFRFGYYYLGIDSFDNGSGPPIGTYKLSIRDWRLCNSHEIAFKNESFTMWIGYSMGVRVGRHKLHTLDDPSYSGYFRSFSNKSPSFGLLIAAAYELNSFFLFTRYELISGGVFYERSWQELDAGVFIPIRWN
jgi:hypothetical protein